jgi:TatA/E family protein of Tat protein translocase
VRFGCFIYGDVCDKVRVQKDCSERGICMEFSPWHLLIVAAVVVLLFGTKKIPDLMRGVGEGVRTFKEGMRGDGTTTPGAPSQVTPSLSLSASPNPAPYGQPITITATLAPAPTGSALGTISFFNGATLLGTMGVNPAGMATLVSTAIPAGATTVTAAYTGSANLTPASAALPVTVNTTVAVTS